VWAGSRFGIGFYRRREELYVGTGGNHMPAMKAFSDMMRQRQSLSCGGSKRNWT
jgi:hypothetical protein